MCEREDKREPRYGCGGGWDTGMLMMLGFVTALYTHEDASFQQRPSSPRPRLAPRFRLGNIFLVYLAQSG